MLYKQNVYKHYIASIQTCEHDIASIQTCEGKLRKNGSVKRLTKNLQLSWREKQGGKDLQIYSHNKEWNQDKKAP